MDARYFRAGGGPLRFQKTCPWFRPPNTPPLLCEGTACPVNERFALYGACCGVRTRVLFYCIYSRNRVTAQPQGSLRSDLGFATVGPRISWLPLFKRRPNSLRSHLPKLRNDLGRRSEL